MISQRGSRDSRVVLNYAGCLTSVEASEPADLGWLREFLEPDFDVDVIALAPHIVMRRDASAIERLLNAGPYPSGDLLPSFGLDGRFETLPRWNNGDDSADVVLYDQRCPAFMRVCANGVVEIIAPPGRPAARVMLMRAVRDRTSACLPDLAALVVHGAALAWKGGSVVIAGAKEAGKTTLLLHLLTTSEAALVANDRSTLRVSNGAVIVRGMPTIVSVRGRSLDFLPHLAERFRRSRYHHRLSFAESQDDAGTAPAGEPTGWSLTPTQLVSLLEVTRSPEVPLSGILLPRQTGRAGGVALRLIPREEVPASLHRMAFSSGSTPFVAPVLEQAVTDTVPLFDCALGTDAYDGRLASRLIETIDAGANPV